MLAEGIARERYEMEVRDKAQEKVRYSPSTGLAQMLLHEIWKCTDFTM